MNSEFLGDALDHWKGSIISILSDRQLLHNIAVEPMISDVNCWSKEDLQTYRRLLKLESTNPICHELTTFIGNRDDYLGGVSRDGDVFIDPDTGIATGNASRKHIKVSELSSLLRNALKHDRVLMVYQHSARGSFHSRLDEVGHMVTNGIPGVHYTVYECGRVAMFFISMNNERIQAIQAALIKYLNGTAENRIWGTT